MTRYYFDLHNGDGPTRTNTGSTCSRQKNIPRELARILLDVARHEPTDGDHVVISVTVRERIADFGCQPHILPISGLAATVQSCTKSKFRIANRTTPVENSCAPHNRETDAL
jgi:arylamine N-acetyltransferase